MSPPRNNEDVRIEILCEKLKIADISTEERDDLADDLRRAENCDDPGTKDILISNVRRAMSEPVRIRRELDSALREHQSHCDRAQDLEKAVASLSKACSDLAGLKGSGAVGAALEFTLPEALGGKPVRVSGGAVYLLIFVISVIVFMKVNDLRRASEVESIRAEVSRYVMTDYQSKHVTNHPAPTKREE